MMFADNMTAEYLRIVFTPVGWKLIDVKKKKRLAFVHGTSQVKYDLHKNLNSFRAGETGIDYNYAYFKPKEIAANGDIIYYNNNHYKIWS